MSALTQRISSFYQQSVRVWKILKKPSALEYKTVAKVSSLGVLVLGAFGFVIGSVVDMIA